METLTKHFREITKAAFARHGFAQADLVSHWADIAGADLAAISAPERIKWPRGPGEEPQKSGGTLVIRAAPGRALDLQYEGPRLLARVNSFFGYGAVTHLKVTQGGRLPAKAPRRALIDSANPVCDQQLGTLEDGPLKDALTRLARGIHGSRISSPQDK